MTVGTTILNNDMTLTLVAFTAHKTQTLSCL